MTDILHSSPNLYGADLADAGITIAHVANNVYDTAKATEGVYQDNDYYRFEHLAGELIGEGMEGAEYLEDRNLPGLSRDVQEVTYLAEAGYLAAKDLGLRPRINKDQVREIKVKVGNAVKVMTQRFPIRTWKGYVDYGVFRSGDDLIVANIDDHGIPVDRLAVNPAMPGENDIFMIQVGDEEFDCRQGMTRGVYLAMRNLRQRVDESRAAWSEQMGHRPQHDETMSRLERGTSRERFATVITGEHTARNGRWVAFPDGTLAPHNPIRLGSDLPTDRSIDLAFRPGVILKGLL